MGEAWSVQAYPDEASFRARTLKIFKPGEAGKFGRTKHRPIEGNRKGSALGRNIAR